jgi:tetratricopeptide (TPR) repeat protein
MPRISEQAMETNDGTTLTPGTRVDEYVIGAVLGRGGFGITYLVHDENLQKDLALKEFFPEDLALRDGTRVRVRSRANGESDFNWGLKKFYDEARLLAQFNHPNIVSVRRVFQANNSAYMLLDFIRGITLEQWLMERAETPTQEELDQLTGPLLSALAVVHANKIWHLDISPDNIMMRAPDHTPVLVDFGASRFEIKQHSRLISALIFKSGYSAPEQYTSSISRYGPWTDIYAFGATLYRAVSGLRPTEATARSLADELEPAVVVARGNYRRRYLDAIDWALKLRPSERPQSVAEWRKQLLPDTSRHVEVLTQGRNGATTPAQDLTVAIHRKMPLGLRAIGAGVVVLVAGLTAAYFLSRQPQPDEAAEKCLRGNHPEDVVQACTLLIQRDPKNALAYAHRGQMLINLSEPTKALDDANRATQLDGQLPDGLVARGAWNRLFGDQETALKDLDRALAINGDYLEGLIVRALVYSNLGRKEEAKRDNDHAVARLNEALLGRPEDARLYRLRGLMRVNNQEFDAGIADYDHAIKLDQDDALAFSGRGYAYSLKRDYDRAITDFDRSIELNSKYFGVYNTRGYALAQKNRLDEALSDYTKALALAPRFAPAYRNRGYAYLAKRDYTRAIADFDEAVKLNFRDASAFGGRGYARSEMWLLDEAIADLDRATTLKPDFYGAFNSRGLAYFRKRDYTRALADYTEAIKLNPGYVTAYHNRAWAYGTQHDYDRAIADYDHLLQFNSADANALRSRGQMLVNKHDFARAIVDYDKAISLNVNDAAAYRLRGYAHLQMNSNDRAIADFDQALRLAPNDPVTLNNRAVVHERRAERELAIADYRTALTIDPNNAFAMNGLKRLGSAQ